jgi:hypothetical protein
MLTGDALQALAFELIMLADIARGEGRSGAYVGCELMLSERGMVGGAKPRISQQVGGCSADAGR